MRIGIDFDNTLVGYDGLFSRLTRERRWLTGRTARTKAQIKRALIAEDGHDLRWQRLQADAYGPRIIEAHASPGALEFVAKARRGGHEVYVVSHKSERSHLDPSIRLRDCARLWLARNGARLPKDRVLFASTRDEKIRMIERLGLDVFIDDLPEVLAHPDFPSRTEKIHLRPKLPWREISRRVDALAQIGADAAAAIHRATGRPCVRATAVRSKGNNRLFRVALEGGTHVLLKRYLVDPRDTRPRARTEFNGLSLLWEGGLRDAPQPIALDPAERFASFSWIPGKPMKGMRPTNDHVIQAASFLRRLRKLSGRSRRRWTTPAADSRSRLSDYAAHIRRRLARVRDGARALGNREALQLVEVSVIPAIHAVIRRLERRAKEAGLSYDAPQPPRERMLSPSDFGFHNAVLCPDGRVRFLDLEYFGWDDPAKLIADFFNHAGQKPLSARQRALFLDRFCRGWSGASAFRRRLDLVLEPISLEWVLIALNVLSSETLARRRFSDPSLDRRRLVAARLRAARARLQRIPTC
ncbi:MAG TPA: hypothetical protein DCZ01_04940 [Elusimicrobia bacterium]|nr:MAG: hypothetical protein A2X40_00245 [Elusimicrobia bacterium GWC2_65_9]OHC66011.1 MAG: hypothetical protein A2040_03440 [Rhodocyclales bacterium GWA2_65_19]HAZ07869.1 hypothetical protein [Elusimicrobiota bacterium]